MLGLNVLVLVILVYSCSYCLLSACVVVMVLILVGILLVVCRFMRLFRKFFWVIVRLNERWFVDSCSWVLLVFMLTMYVLNALVSRWNSVFDSE